MNESTRGSRRLRDQYPTRNPGYQPVTAREIGCDDRSANREFGDYCSFGPDFVGQFPVACRIDAINPGPDESQGVSSCAESATMRRGVNTQGHAADDGQAAPGQCAGELFGVQESLRRRIAATDDAQSRAIQQLQPAANVHYRRWIGNFQ